MGAGNDVNNNSTAVSASFPGAEFEVCPEESENQHVAEVVSEIERKIEDANLKVEWIKLIDYKGEHEHPHHIYDFTEEYRTPDEDASVVPTQTTTHHHHYKVCTCEGSEQVYENWAKFYDNAPDKHVQLVFHGTTPDAIESICQCGFDEKKRGTCVGNLRGAGEYTSIQAGTCARYSKHGQQILVCRLALGQRGEHYERPYDGYMYVSRDTRQLLPLAVVKFRCNCQ